MALVFLTIIRLGTAPRPCPIVAALPVPVKVTIEKPAVVFADTVEVTLPSALDEPEELPALQFQAT